MEISDKELAVLAGQGDAEAYRRLFERYQHPVYNFVYRLVDNAADASDIVQDAFIRMYTILGERDIQNFSAYLYRTAKNLAYDEMRRRKRFVDVDEEILAPEDPNIYADPQRALLLGEQMETVRRAARGLNENQRAALILRELEELDYDEMSDVLESNRNAVGALLSRARLKFREELRMAQIQTDTCPPECEEVIAMLSPYIDGELALAEKDRVETHLEECTFCLAALEEMREASRSFRMFIPVIPPAGLAQAFTGRLGDLDATRVYEGQPGSGASRMARLLHSRAFWVSAAAATVFLVASVGLFAELTGGPDTNNNRALLTDTGVASTSTRSDDVVSPVSTSTAGIIADDTATVSDTSRVSGDDAGGTPTTPDQPTAAIAVISGSARPNPAYQGESITYSTKISGSASAVILTLVSDYDGSSREIALSRQSTEGDLETWGASGVAGKPQGYNLYVTATDAAGQQVEGYVGMLTVYPAIY